MHDKKPTALLIITTEFLPVRGGIGNYTFHVAKNLASITCQKVMVLTIRMRGAKEFDRHQQFTIYRAGGDYLRYLKIIPLFLKLLTIRRSFNIKHIIAASWNYAGVLGWLSNRLWRIRYSLFTYGLEVTKYQRMPIIKGLLRIVLNRSRLIFAISHYAKSCLEELGINEEKIRVVYGGVDPRVFRPGLDSSQLIRKYSLINKKVVLTVGRLVKRKGHDLVIEALPMLLREYPDLVYLIVGDGPERPKLKSLSERLQVSSNIIFAPQVEDDMLPYYYNLCQIMVMVNRKIGRDVEGFGLVFLEANACGKPVIGGRNGGVVDAVSDGQTGLLVDDSNKESITRAILTLLKNEDYARKLGENGRQRVLKELNWGEISRKIFLYIEEANPDLSSSIWEVLAMNRIKVVHIITRLDRGGSADNTLITVMELDRKKFEVTLIAGKTTEPSPKLAQLKGQTYISFFQIPQLVREVSPYNDLIAFIKLYRLLKRGRFNIVHTHSSKAGILGRWAARLAKAPYIVHTPHGNIFYGYYGRLLTYLFILMERFSARFTHRIITLTNKGIEEHLGFKVGFPDKFRSIYSGIDLSSFLEYKDDAMNVKKELGIPVNHRVVGSVARLVPVKDHITLIKAAPLIAEAFPQVSFLLVGDGPLRSRVESLAEKLGVGKRVIITGMRDDIPRLLSAMDIVTLTSLNEGMGRSLVEAMAMGRAVVATDVGGVAEVVENGATGILVPPSSCHKLAEAVIELLRDDKKRESFGWRARNMVARFSAQAMVREIEKLYIELI